MSRWTSIIILFAVFLISACWSKPGSAGSSSAELRVALVIGNSTYRNVPRLDNPAKDARLMADTLQALGFAIVGGSAQLDLDKTAFDNAVRSFGRQLQGANVGLFYYAGHGIQVRGANYLVPVNADPAREADLDFELEDVSLVLRQMEGSGTRLNLVFLDACRNNPFGGRGLRALDSGLAQMRAPEGTVISFATQPGNVALDGGDGNSPFTSALVQTIRRPGLGIFDALNEIGLTVKRTTGGSQQPWFSSSPISGAFYFASAPELPQPDTSARTPNAPPRVATTTPMPAKMNSKIAPSIGSTTQEQPICFGPKDCEDHPGYLAFGNPPTATPVLSRKEQSYCFGPEDCKKHPDYLPIR
jgi:uncharacterized caspase-like protein